MIQNLLFITFLLLLLIRSERIVSQEDSRKSLPVTVINGDSLPTMNLGSVNVVERRQFKSNADRRRYDRLERYVTKAYPYAELAGALLKNYDDTLTTIKMKCEEKPI